MFCLICMDRPESQDLRLANRPDHLAYVLENPGVVVAGPFLDEDGETMIGSMIVLDVKRAPRPRIGRNDPMQGRIVRPRGNSPLEASDRRTGEPAERKSRAFGTTIRNRENHG